MKYKFEKNMRIASDLITYLHKLGAEQYHLDLDLRGDVSTFSISCPLKGIRETEVRRLEEVLNTPRQREVEQYYWVLSGEVDTEPELELVGIMVDSAKVTYQDGTLTIVAQRRHQQ